MWRQLTDLTINREWQTSPIILTGEVFRFRFLSQSGFSRIAIRQAERRGINLELFGEDSLFVNKDATILQLPCPAFFNQRRLAVRGFYADRSDPSPLRLRIEVSTMPVFNPPTPPPPTVATTSVNTTVASSTNSVTLLEANPDRKGYKITNASSARLFVDFGSVVSSANYSIILEPGGFYESPPWIYTGEISGVWSSANGSAFVREMI